MIDKMAESIFESMLPLTIEQLSSSPLINYLLNEEDDKNGVQDYHMLSDVHWKKFELDFPELSDIDDIFKELDAGINSSNWQCSFEDNKDRLLNHDCMWAGHCGSKEHPEEPRHNLSFFVPKPPVIKKEMCPPAPIAPKVANEQQSLLKSSVKATSVATTNFTQPPGNSTTVVPVTPPESDDEENKAHTTTLLKILHENMDECDIEEDRDLTEYFEGKEIDIKEEPVEIKEEVLAVKQETDDVDEEQDELSYQQYRIRTQLAAENDHSYHKDKNAAMRHNSYGIDTPSDSEEEEEIDVVSVSEKFTNASRMALTLPTNPSFRDRHQLQRRVATAMSKKRTNNGIKTILPVRNAHNMPSSSSTSSSSSSGRRGGIKRGRNNRNTNGHKRRRMNNMDSEREPTDKRHLHNDMERQRRVDLRIAFENLKSVVPEVSGTKKIAKVNILLQAAQYCYFLTGTNMNYVKQLEELKRKQVWLRSRVSQLRRNLAARR